MKNFLSIKERFWDLLVVQWLILCLLMQGVWAWFLVGELRSQGPHGQKIKIKQKQYGNKFNKDFKKLSTFLKKKKNLKKEKWNHKTLKICEILPKRKIKIPSKQHGPGDTRNPGTAGLFPSMWESVSQGTLVMAWRQWQRDGQIPRTSTAPPKSQHLRGVQGEMLEGVSQLPHRKRRLGSIAGETRFYCQEHRQYLSSQSTALQHEASPPRKRRFCLFITWTPLNQSY